MSGTPPPRPAKRPATGAATSSPRAEQHELAPQFDHEKMIVTLAVRGGDKWASVIAKDNTKWYRGKPVNPNWNAVNAALRQMKPSVHEFDKRVEAEQTIMKHYPASFGNARDIWEFTCPAKEFVEGVHSCLSTGDIKESIERFEFVINHGSFKPPQKFLSLEAFVAAIEMIPEPQAPEEEEEPEPSVVQQLKHEIEQLKHEIARLKQRLSALEA